MVPEITAIKDSFTPKQYEDLEKSGLSYGTILSAGIKAVRPADINKKLGFNMPGLQSMYEIPYNNAYSRYRVFYEPGCELDRDGKPKPKYLCRKDSGNHLYVPPNARPFLCNTAVPLYITEGEKKALKAAQEGLCCIAISGLWNWSDGSKQLVSDFDQIATDGRLIYIVPDNDWLHPNKHGYEKNLRKAVYSLAERLVARKARVFIIHLPKSEKE